MTYHQHICFCNRSKTSNDTIEPPAVKHKCYVRSESNVIKGSLESLIMLEIRVDAFNYLLILTLKLRRFHVCTNVIIHYCRLVFIVVHKINTSATVNRCCLWMLSVSVDGGCQMKIVAMNVISASHKLILRMNCVTPGRNVTWYNSCNTVSLDHKISVIKSPTYLPQLHILLPKCHRTNWSL